MRSSEMSSGRTFGMNSGGTLGIPGNHNQSGNHLVYKRLNNTQRYGNKGAQQIAELWTIDQVWMRVEQ